MAFPLLIGKKCEKNILFVFFISSTRPPYHHGQWVVFGTAEIFSGVHMCFTIIYISCLFAVFMLQKIWVKLLASASHNVLCWFQAYGQLFTLKNWHIATQSLFGCWLPLFCLVGHFFWHSKRVSFAIVLSIQTDSALLDKILQLEIDETCQALPSTCWSLIFWETNHRRDNNQWSWCLAVGSVCETLISDWIYL